MFSKPKNSLLLIGALCVAVTSLAGCSSKDDELEQYISDTKKEPGGRVEPLPELKPYETYAYESVNMRSPFMPGGSGGGSASGLRPDNRRNREFLEQFSLDTLRMVGTLKLADRTYGLVKTKDGLVHRVLPGNYLGQADGRVTDITPSKISVVEIVADGLGGYMERPASLALNN
ncbi:MAG TPA: pilus assembly protein PilP [Steroidobacteraceae bacterium]|nr:pilus assembly protein PilP [Steroidobacteraceae bacterium]